MCQSLQTNKAQSVVVDPSKQAGNRRRAMANIRNRLAIVRKNINELIDSIPVKLSVNNSIAANRNSYVWEMSPQRQSQVDVFIRDIVNRWFETQTPEKPARWFFDVYIESATNPATVDAVSNVKLLSQGIASTATLDATTVQSIFLEPQYKSIVGNIYGRVFNEMKGFSGQTATDLARVLSDSVMLGESPRKAKAKLMKRMGVADSRAERISRTEINRAYTVTRTKTAKVVADELEVEIMLVHRSSLIPGRTRPAHAARHGKMYTPQEQDDWWDSDANRINCLCSINEVVIENGKPRDRGLIKKLEQQLDDFKN